MPLLFAFLLMASIANAHTYADHSVLQSGSFTKISVAESGLHTITFDQLRAHNIDPATLRIYGYGGAMLSQDFRKTHIDDLPVVPYLRLSDRIVFYAQGSISWSYNGTYFTHTRNPYSDLGYYFLTSSSAQEIAETAPVSGSASAVVTSYTAYVLHEKDSINLIDYREGKAGGGREFYGEMFTPGTKRSFNLSFPESTEATSARIRVDMAANSTALSSFTINCDGSSFVANASAIASSDFYTKAEAASINKTFTPSVAAPKRVDISFTSSAGTALGFLNYIELTATCPLRITGNAPLFFRTTVGLNSSSNLSFRIEGATSETQVWDITDLAHIVRMPATVSGSTLSFVANNSTLHQYVAFNPSATSYLSPSWGNTILNQDLHALSDIDMVIITPEEFLSEAQRLGAAHEEHDGFTMAVVTDQQVYNEFSSGTPDATAYRWLMKMLYDRSGNQHQGAPKYLLLFGAGSYDNRQLIYSKQTGQVLSGRHNLLTYQAKNSLHEVKAYATDDYFGFLDDNEGESDISGLMDISVGRLPVSTAIQAQEVVDKLIRHMQPSHGRWKTQMVFMADDDDHNLHTRCIEDAAEKVRVHCPDFQVNKLYFNAYAQEVNASGESYPLVEMRLNNLLQSGVLLFDYCGHSGYNNASSEGIISSAKIRDMQNDNCGFWMFASCSFAHFDGQHVSAAEEAVLNPEGGAIAVCSANRTVYATPNSILNRHICDSLFAHRSPYHYPHRIGDAVRLGKNAVGLDDNKMSFVLLGDPATSLHLPVTYQVRTTALADTLNALSVNTLQGCILDENGDTATYFNGPLTFTVFDKLQQITTLDNDEPDPDNKKIEVYNDYPNILFQGETQVVNGYFTAQFMVPKDIRYNYGNGRIIYYAYDSEYGDEAIGHYEDLVIGGSSTVAIEDTEGPDLHIYLNTPSFVDGGRVNETPHFYADIHDENGINTVGSGIGHDLLLVVDDKPAQTYVLNDYFTANQSFQAGQVSYRMSEMSEGQHSLTFRAFDLLNNSSTASLNFSVVKGLETDIVGVTCFPNPIVIGDMLNIQVDHTSPDIIFQTSVFIYDLSGRLVYNLTQRGTENIQWDIQSSTTPAGMYLYKVQLSSEKTKSVSKTGKLIITK